MKFLKHIERAVALKYRPEADKAPKVVAKGAGQVAQRIIEIAEANGIYIHNDPDLIEVLAQLDLDAEIPAELYVVVAELLAFVYTLGRNPFPE